MRLQILLLCCLAVGVAAEENQRVIVGVLAETDPNDRDHQIIGTSYVKFLESGGARVVPVLLGRDREYYESMVKRINGVLMPGGDASQISNQESLYNRASNILLDLAYELNKNGTNFPVWGTCLSFEKIISYTVGDNSWMTACDLDDFSINLDITTEVLKNPKSTRMFQDEEGPKILQIMQKHNVAPNFHHFCLTTEKFHDFHLDKHFRLISTNTVKNVTYVSTIEHRNLSIYGTQWHPEINLFEFLISENINHDRYAVKVSQFLANFFVNEARKNSQHFENRAEEIQSLIYNYDRYLQYTAKIPGAIYDEEYVIPLV